jgi:hypothetical protein
VRQRLAPFDREAIAASADPAAGRFSVLVATI